jgi:hypothetical protein
MWWLLRTNSSCLVVGAETAVTACSSGGAANDAAGRAAGRRLMAALPGASGCLAATSGQSRSRSEARVFGGALRTAALPARTGISASAISSLPDVVLAAIRSRRRSSGGDGRHKDCQSDQATRHSRALESAGRQPENQPDESDVTAQTLKDSDSDSTLIEVDRDCRFGQIACKNAASTRLQEEVVPGLVELRWTRASRAIG